MPIDQRGAEGEAPDGGLDHPGQMGIEGVTAAWHRAADALHDSERRYRELVEYSLGLICTHDLDGTILSINPAAAHSLGYQPEDGIGRDLRDFLSADTRHLFDDYLDRIVRNGDDAGLMRVVARSGDTRIWMYRNVLSRDRHGTAYVLGHAIDITERVAAERTLRESEQNLRLAQAELEARVKERTAALERANERLHLEIAERERAEQARERALVEQRDTLAFLAGFSERLAPIVRFEELVDVIGGATVPFPAVWSIVYVVNDDGFVRAMPGAHADAVCRAALSSLAEAVSGAAPPGSLLAEVVATDRVVIETSASANLAARLAGRRGAATALRRAGSGGVAMVPLPFAGRVRAVLALGTRDPARFAGAGALIVEDIARRVRLALDRIQLYREIQEANRLKDEFLSTLSHELRTPLNAILGWARILGSRELDGGTGHAVHVIERNADAQLRLIEDVLDVSRIVTGKMRLALERVDLSGIVGACIDTVRPALQAKGIQFTATLEPEVPPVIADTHRIQQAFSNVLSNAVKFTGAGGTISVTLRTAGQAVECEIADSGVGIHRDVLPFVFDRFRQADSSLARTHGGLGLGLAIVRHIVELHGGTVTAASPGEGRGATFTIRLPAGDRNPEAAAASASAPMCHFDVAPLLCGQTVLVVEDHDDARELIVRVLQSAGAEVVSAAAAEEALDRAARQVPDVLVTDIGLPKEDGYSLLRRIRTLCGADLPAIALTAYARAADRERALAAGFQQHVVKPVDPQRLVEIVAATLQG